MNVRLSLAAVVHGASLVAVVAVVAGCGREGAWCVSDTSRCASPNEAVFCVNGRIARSRCRGPRGCQVDGATVRCDQSVASVGERCTGAGAACSVDGTEMLECTNGRFAAVSSCRGAGRCAVDASSSLTPGSVTVHCDHALAQAGDPCTSSTEGHHACSADGANWLVCRQGRFEVAIPCRGPNRCTATESGPDQGSTRCDNSIAAAGDPCQVGDQESHACSVDGALDLVCRNGRMEIDRACRGAQHCRVVGTNVDCDASLVVAGDPCTGESHRCSTQGGNVLRCASGRYEPDPTAVPGSCEVEGSRVTWDYHRARGTRLARRR